MHRHCSAWNPEGRLSLSVEAALSQKAFLSMFQLIDPRQKELRHRAADLTRTDVDMSAPPGQILGNRIAKGQSCCMDDVQQFLLRIAPDGKAQHFELRHDDAERPFHLSIAPDARHFTLNARSAGAWEGGTTYPQHAVSREHPPGGAPVLVHRQGRRVAVVAGDLIAVWSIPPERMRSAWPQPAAGGLAWQELAPAQRLGIDWPDDDPTPRLYALPLPGGARLEDMSEQPAGLVLQIFDEAMTHAPALLRHVAANPAPAAIVVQDAPGCGLMLAALMPEVPLFLAPPTGADPAPLVALARAARVPCKVLPADRPAREGQADGALVLGHALRAEDWPGAASIFDLSAGALSTSTVAEPAPACAAAAPIPIVSGLDVVVALFNTQEHALTCIESLRMPGRRDIRIRVIDDGSTDGSGDLVAQHFAGDPQIEVLHKANGGCASARNHGRLMSDRTHIAFVDADDLAEPGLFAALLDLARGTGADLVQGGFDFLDPAREPPRWPYGGDLELTQTLPHQVWRGETVIAVPPRRLLRSQPSVWRMVCRRAFLDAHDIWFPESIRAFDDFLFHLRCMLHARSLWMMPGRKYLYRQHPGQDIRQADARHFGNLAMVMALAREGAAIEAPLPAVVDVIDWSAKQIAPELRGTFLAAAADLCVTLERMTGCDDLQQPAGVSVGHADFAPLLAAARARVAASQGGEWWRWAEPALAHPGLVAQLSAQRRAV